MQDIIGNWVTLHPQIVGILALLCVIQKAGKLVMLAVEQYVKTTPTQKDDAFLLDIESSRAWKAGAWLIDFFTSIKVGPQLEKMVKGIPKPPVLAVALGLLLAATGCTAIKQGDIVSVKTRGFGLSLAAASTTTATPEVKFGWFSSVVQMIPTSTNGPVYAPKYFDTLEVAQSVNPFNTGIAENTGSGDVMVSTNAQGSAIIPKLNRP